VSQGVSSVANMQGALDKEKEEMGGRKRGSRMGREGEVAKTDLSVRGLGGTFCVLN